MLPRNRLLQTAKRAVAIPVDWRFGRSRYAEKAQSHLPRGPAAPLNYPLNVVPRQNSSGGKPSLGRITKRGDTYLRTLLIQGAKSAVMSADKRDDATSRWLKQLIERVGWQKACVAMANKNARILWAVMTREQGFDAQHVSAKPLARQKPAPAPACEVATA